MRPPRQITPPSWMPLPQPCRGAGQKFHAHFSRIAYTKGGEKCHLTFADTEFGPPPAPLMQLLKTRGLAPTIICESAGTQAEDAAALKNCMNKAEKAQNSQQKPKNQNITRKSR